MNTFIRIKQSKKEKNITHLSLHNQQTTGTLIQQLDTTAWAWHRRSNYELLM